MQSHSFPSHVLLLLVLALVFGSLGFMFFKLLGHLLQWWHYQQDKRLPPGSMGWPFLGETLKLYTQNPNTFFSKRLKRYGEIFKTYILGCPCVLISNPEAMKLVLVTQSSLFKPTYPPSKEKLIGPSAVFFHHGHYHSRLRKIFQSFFAPNSIKGSISNIENIVLGFLPCWENTPIINTLNEMKKYTFDVAMLSVFGRHIDEVPSETIKHLYLSLDNGYNSMPFNFPGTPFRKALKARKGLNDILMRIILEKRKKMMMGEKEGGLLEELLSCKIDDDKEEKKEYLLSDSEVADNIIGVIFAARDTTASVITWCLKFMHDNQEILNEVRMEQQGIRRIIIEEKRSLTWEDTRKMPFTTLVFQETLRRASVISFTFRETVTDLDFEGFFIPKGWKVLPLFRSIHLSENLFPEPHTFDPSRFQVPPKPNTFTPFGNGVHSCPGNELAKLEILVFLHYITTTYRWEPIEDDKDGIQYSPFPVPKRGLPIRVRPLISSTDTTIDDDGQIVVNC